tara:strand:+ start:88 stop:336 length:249 start_codon:yes stop_codon:yes gene_type:complete
MNNKKEFEEQLSQLREKIKEVKQEKTKLKQHNEKLQDEIDSLWAMMDEMTRADIENWKHIAGELQTDTIIKALMVSKNKAEA